MRPLGPSSTPVLHESIIHPDLQLIIDLHLVLFPAGGDTAPLFIYRRVAALPRLVVILRRHVITLTGITHPQMAGGIWFRSRGWQWLCPAEKCPRLTLTNGLPNPKSRGVNTNEILTRRTTRPFSVSFSVADFYEGDFWPDHVTNDVMRWLPSGKSYIEIRDSPASGESGIYLIDPALMEMDL